MDKSQFVNKPPLAQPLIHRPPHPENDSKHKKRHTSHLDVEDVIELSEEAMAQEQEEQIHTQAQNQTNNKG